MELYGLDMLKTTLVALKWGTITSGIPPVMLLCQAPFPLFSSRLLSKFFRHCSHDSRIFFQAIIVMS